MVHYDITDEEILQLYNGEEVNLANRFTMVEIHAGFTEDLFLRVVYEDECTRLDYTINTCSSGRHIFGDTTCSYLKPENSHLGTPAVEGGFYTTTLKPCDMPSGGNNNNNNNTSGNWPHGIGSGNNSSSPTTCSGGKKCVPVDTAPVGQGTDPCQEITEQIANADFVAKVNIVNSSSAFNSNQETGFSQKTDGTFNGLSAMNGGHALSIPITNTMIGFLHSHINGYLVPDTNGDGIPDEENPIKMLSPGDIITFLQLLENANANNIPLNDIYGSMYSSEGNYTIKFTGDVTDVLSNLNNLETLRNNKTLNTKYKAYFNDYGNKEKAMLNFLKNEIGIDGIRLFKIKNNGTIKEKSLNDNGNVESETC